jgi:hypothetical protein
MPIILRPPFAKTRHTGGNLDNLPFSRLGRDLAEVDDFTGMRRPSLEYPRGLSWVSSMDDRLTRPTRRGFLLGAALNLALILYGMVRFPTSWNLSLRGLDGFLATTGILAVYALIGWFGPPGLERRQPGILRDGARFGVAIGAFFASTMLVEYLVPRTPEQNAWFAVAIFGTFFSLLVVAGFIGTRRKNRLWLGVLTSVWSALIASLIWFILLLAIYYAFLDTTYEARFLETDQVIADFKRSGMQDLRAFILQDYLGGGFFHSLLGPILAFPLGALGGLTAKALDRLGWISGCRAD